MSSFKGVSFFYFVHSWQRHPIGDRSLSAVNLFLDSMAKEARNILSQMCPDYIQLNQQVSNQHLILHFSVHGNACMPCSETSVRFGQYSLGGRCDGVGLRIGRSGFEPWPGTSCPVLSQNTLPSQCRSPPRCLNWYWSIVWPTWQNSGVGLQWTSIPIQEEVHVGILLAAPCYGNWRWAQRAVSSLVGYTQEPITRRVQLP